MLWLTVPDSTGVPTTSWGYLAGSSAGTTIEDSGSNSVFYEVPHQSQAMIKVGGLLHVAMAGFTDSTNPTYLRAHVARREEDESWTLLGGDPGIQHSTSGSRDRQTLAIHSFQGDLYAFFREGDGSSAYIGRVARWNTSTSSWVILTTQTDGIHHDSSGSPKRLTGADNFDSNKSSAYFVEIAGELHVLYYEGSSTLAASKYNGTTFVRVATTSLSGYSGTHRFSDLRSATTLNERAYLFIRGGDASNVWEYDGVQIITKAADTGKRANALTAFISLSGATAVPVNGFSFFEDQGKLISMWNEGDEPTASMGTNSNVFSSLVIRESTDGGQTWQSHADTSIALLSNYKWLRRARMINGKIYALVQNDSYLLSTRFGSQPHEMKLLRRDGSSWTELGGGTPRLGTTTNILRMYARDRDKPRAAWVLPGEGWDSAFSLAWIDNAPYISWQQSSQFDSAGAGAVDEDIHYIAWTAP